MLGSGFRKSIAIVGTMMLMVGCGSDSGSFGGFSGKFVDGAIDGVTFECADVTGVTVNGGIFGVCPEDSTVNFSIGNLQLGSATESEGGEDNIFTLNEVASNPTVAKKIAQIILTVTNPNASATETLTINATDITAINALNLTSVTIDTTIPETIGGVSTVSETDAQTHLDLVVDAISSGAIVAPSETSIATD